MDQLLIWVDENDEVIGYIAYAIDWAAMSADKFGIISFDKVIILFFSFLYNRIVIRQY